MAAPKKPVAKVAKPKAEPYAVRVNIAGRNYGANGSTALDAIGALKVSGTPRGKVIMVVTKGALTRERVLAPFVVARLFSPSRLQREMALKNVSMLFDL